MSAMFDQLSEYVASTKTNPPDEYGHVTLFFMNWLQQNGFDPIQILLENNIKVKTVHLNDTNLPLLYKLNDVPVPNQPFPPTKTVYILNYEQIDPVKQSPIKKGHPINTECRSMIVTFQKQWVLYSRAFARFLNYGERRKGQGGGGNDNDDHKLCLDDYQVFIKEDGSIMQLTFDSDYRIWIPFTRGSDASMNPLDYKRAESETFADHTFRLLGSSLRKLNPSFTYLFELCIPQMHITRYDTPKLSLIGITNHYAVKRSPSFEEYVTEFQKIKSETIDFPHFPHSKTHLTTQDLDRWIDDRKDATFEGFVLWNPITNDRMKYKSKSYLRLFHIAGESMSLPRIADAVLGGEGDEVSLISDQYAQIVADMTSKIQSIVDNVQKVCDDTTANNWGEKDYRKQFAISIKDNPNKGILFKLWNKDKNSISEKDIRALIDPATLF